MNHAPAHPGLGERTQVATRFWDASETDDRLAWLAMWRRWPGREVMAHPDYVRLFARPGDRVMAAAVATGEGGVLYPFILRSLAGEEWGAGEAGLCDLTSAYGYGGPFAWNVEAAEAKSFLSDFESWIRRRGVVTSFARLSLFEDERLPFPGDQVDRGTNIVRSLELGPEELWGDYEAKVRKNVQKARRDGVEIRYDERGDRLDEFMAIYKSTMDRRNARPDYYHSRSFYETLLSRFPGQAVLVHAIQHGNVVSSEMLLVSARTAYSFLGGTLAEAFGSRPNDLLKHDCFLRCREWGLKRFVLGGGYVEGDSVLRYKKAFAPDGELRFRVGQAVYDAAAAAALADRRRAWERSHGREWTPVPGYFPPYRS